MKKTLLLLTLLMGLGHLAYSQVSLQCPPCAPVQGCSKCYETVAAAEADGCNSASRVATSPADQLEATVEDLNVFPNPSYDGFFSLQMPENFRGHIMVMNLSGQLVHRYIANGASSFRSSEQLKAGAYFVVLKGENGSLQRKMLLVY